MPSIKIYPPSQLPNKKLTETQFSIWKEELEVYLSQEKTFQIFLPGQNYENWESAESFNLRIRNLRQIDEVQQDRERNAEQAREENEEKLAELRTSLRTMLAIVGKCVTEGHYNSVVRHSTSMNWIYEMIKSDYDIQSKGIHFFHVINIKYDEEKHTPVTFYNEYRTTIINNLAKAGDIIKHKNNEVMLQDEKMTPMLEDMVLLNVIKEIDCRLPNHIKVHYNHKMSATDRLMDFKTDILVNIPTFINELENKDQHFEEKEAALHAIKRFNNKKRFSAQPQLYCRMCWLAKLPRDIYVSHNIGDDKCPQLSAQDKLKLKQISKLNSLKEHDDDYSYTDEQLASQFGYTCEIANESDEEVNKDNNLNDSIMISHRNKESKCSFIKPVASQILTVFADKYNKIPLHIEMDSGASINFCEEAAVLNYGFKIKYSKQVSKLGDGSTKVESIGEINEIFYRNNWTVIYRAAVCKQLSSPFIGGTVFMKENGVEQDFAEDNQPSLKIRLELGFKAELGNCVRKRRSTH